MLKTLAMITDITRPKERKSSMKLQFSTQNCLPVALVNFEVVQNSEVLSMETDLGKVFVEGVSIRYSENQ